MIEIGRYLTLAFKAFNKSGFGDCLTDYFNSDLLRKFAVVTFGEKTALIPPAPISLMIL